MRYSRQLRQVRRVRKTTKIQYRQLMALELDGIVAITLHSATSKLTISIERVAGAQVVDTLCEVLRTRRQDLKAEARQLRQDWQEGEHLLARTTSARSEQPLVGKTPDA